MPRLLNIPRAMDLDAHLPPMPLSTSPSQDPEPSSPLDISEQLAFLPPNPFQEQPQPPPTPRPANHNPLNVIPTDIAHHRALLFALDTPVQLTPAVWSRFWPYMDNVWCVYQKPIPSAKTGIAKIYGGCRLNRKVNLPPPKVHDKSRVRTRKETGTCKAKFRLTIYPDGKRVLERTGEGHSHTLDHLDSQKRPSGVRSLVQDEFFKGWEAGGILAFLRDSSKNMAAAPGQDLLKDAGGLYLSRQEVHNIINSAMKRAYPGLEVGEVKRQMDKYRSYTICNWKGCDAPAFPDSKSLGEHRRAVHGFKSHDHSDKQYACPEKDCWRHKKSKGFATLFGLEEHLKLKHGSAASISESVEEGTVQAMDGDSTMLDSLPTPQMTASLANVSMGIGMNMMFPSDPITPDSTSAEDAPQHSATDLQLTAQDAQPVQETQAEETVLTHEEADANKRRIRRLMIERSKLDAEIRRLNQVVYGNEKGEGTYKESNGNG